ncbi:MAG: alkaline phosphatase D [Kiritimatiellia bacterium]|jgi:alkaline phosphatase D
MKNILISFLLLCVASSRADEAPISRISFGSCIRQTSPMEFWPGIERANPELFIFLGDNIYGDTRDMKKLEQTYGVLGAQPGFQRLRESAHVRAIWDDHDYGENDAGVEYPMKKEAQAIFLDFWKAPADDPRRSREGIYTSELFGPVDQRIQLINLDTRYFRSPLIKRGGKGKDIEGSTGPYTVNPDPTTTLLGAAQWAWLEEQFKQPARLRIIASSIQLVANDHHWEKWGNHPHERERMFQLIRDSKAEGVLFLSGDRHRGEISVYEDDMPYPLFDITASSLNTSSGWRNEINRHRYGSLVFFENFGCIEVDWTVEDPAVTLQLRDDQGKVVVQVVRPLSAFSPGR